MYLCGMWDLVCGIWYVCRLQTPPNERCKVFLYTCSSSPQYYTSVENLDLCSFRCVLLVISYTMRVGPDHIRSRPAML